MQEMNFAKLTSALEKLSHEEIDQISFNTTGLHVCNLVNNTFTGCEDKLLKKFVASKGENWPLIGALMPGRTSYEVEHRYKEIQTQPWTSEEDAKLIDMVRAIGTHWIQIKSCFPDRTCTSIKNRWVSLIRKNNLEPQQNALNQSWMKQQRTMVKATMPITKGPSKRKETRNILSNIQKKLNIEPNQEKIVQMNDSIRGEQLSFNDFLNDDGFSFNDRDLFMTEPNGIEERHDLEFPSELFLF